MANSRFGRRRQYFIGSSAPVGGWRAVYRRDPFRRHFEFLTPVTAPPATGGIRQWHRRDPFRRHFEFLAPVIAPPAAGGIQQWRRRDPFRRHFEFLAPSDEIIIDVPQPEGGPSDFRVRIGRHLVTRDERDLLDIIALVTIALSEISNGP